MTGIDALAGYTSTYLENVQSQNSSSAASVAAKRDYSKATEEELMEACKEFEAYFVEQVFKAMRATVPESEESSSTSALDMFEDTLYQEYAKQSAESGQLGLAQQLFEQMKRNYGLE